ncbi:hypothetical protein VCRA2116O29_110081 [Vibrio crassostreae]|nr:hypothetical protein VCRA2116O29_110081 [Vibrio crassostreae]CAK3564830.1 hypothetical protein VCRA2123O74_110021 [Vibrio crassostreae]CAK3789415.1 hypothetical protein VCRA212O16_150101 [Vibrio crassostreae]
MIRCYLQLNRTSMSIVMGPLIVLIDSLDAYKGLPRHQFALWA